MIFSIFEIDLISQDILLIYCPVLLVIVSQRFENMAIRMLGTKAMVKRLEEWEKQDRGALPSYVESLIVLYILGFVWAEIKQLWDAGGMLTYAQDMWNFVDFAINFFYCAWIGLRSGIKKNKDKQDIFSWYLVSLNRIIYLMHS